MVQLDLRCDNPRVLMAMKSCVRGARPHPCHLRRTRHHRRSVRTGATLFGIVLLQALVLRLESVKKA
jgi:hypothetical protein